MKRSIHLIASLLVVLLVAACSQAPEIATERALLDDADLDAATLSIAAPASLERASVGLSSAERRAAPTRESLEAEGLGGFRVDLDSIAAPSDLASQRLQIDNVSHVVFPYTFTTGSGGTGYLIRVKRTGGAGRPGFFNEFLLYEGLRRVESAAITADGQYIAFIAEAASGSLEVFVYDRDGSRLGIAGALFQLTDTPESDETDVSMALGGGVIAWERDEPGTDTRSVLVHRVDPATGMYAPYELSGEGFSIVEPSLSGNGRMVVFVAEFAAIGDPPDSIVAFDFRTEKFTFLYNGDADEPSLSFSGDRLMFRNVYEGLPFINVIDFLTGDFFFNLFPGGSEPYITADGQYYAFGLGEDVFGAEIATESGDFLLEGEGEAISANPGFHEYAPYWAKTSHEVRYRGTTTGRPTFVRPDLGYGLSVADRTVPYHAYEFRGPANDVFEMISLQDYDGALFLYRGRFNPATPEYGLLESNDDSKSFDPDEMPAGASTISFELEAGKLYTLVTAACGNPAAGCGPMAGQFVNVIRRRTAPPLPVDELPEPDPSGYDITLRVVAGDDELTEAQRAVLEQAAERWESIIVGDLADLPGFYLSPSDVSLPGSNPIGGTLDDVLIDLAFVDIDGPSGVLGRAGPRLIRRAEDAPLTVYGYMEFDISEFGEGGFFDDEAQYRDVIVHEMGHVIGIGTLWTIEGLNLTEGVLSNPPTVAPGAPNPDYDPRFVGEAASAFYDELLAEAGRSDPADGVPIANTGGPGNYNGHWREISFGNELMTPYAGGLELLSLLTVYSLGDLGYTIDDTSGAIDFEYALPLAATLERVTPDPTTFVEFEDFLRASGSRGSVTAEVAAVDFDLSVDESTSGCELEDFYEGGDVTGTSLVAGEIALIRRGTCAFTDKFENAAEAGAVGVVIFNQGDGDDPTRFGLFSPSVGDSGLPGVAVTYDLGTTFANQIDDGLVLSIDTPIPEADAGSLAPQRLSVLDEILLEPVGTVAPDGTIRYFGGSAPTYAPIGAE